MTEFDEPDNSDESMTNSNSKVASVIHQHDLDSVSDELVEHWTGDATEQMSLREFADYFNRELLAQTIRDASLNTLDGEPANLYRLLTDDSVSSGASIQAKNQLEQHGMMLTSSWQFSSHDKRSILSDERARHELLHQ